MSYSAEEHGGDKPCVPLKECGPLVGTIPHTGSDVQGAECAHPMAVVTESTVLCPGQAGGSQREGRLSGDGVHVGYPEVRKGSGRYLEGHEM